MSFSIVRTCRRCGARAEGQILDLEGVEALIRLLRHHFTHPDADNGCPACVPELSELAKRAGVDLDAYDRTVATARRNRSS